MGKRKEATAYIFLDTNIYLEFKDFDQIDWPDVLDYQRVCILLAPITFHELEGFKYDQKSDRRQKRSRSLIKKINAITELNPTLTEMEVPGRASVTMRVLTTSPDMSGYPDLQISSNDDQLLASALMFITDNPGIPREDVLIIADDGGVRAKARARNIVAKALDESLQLALEPTLAEKELAEAKRQLALLQNKVPKLQLARIDNGQPGQKLSVVFEAIPDLTVEALNKKYQEEEQATSWSMPPGAVTDEESSATETPQLSPALTIADILKAIARNQREGYIPQNDIKRYEQERVNYLRKYKQYLIERYRWEQITALSKDLELSVINGGTTPAIGLTIQLNFPPGFNVFEKKELPKEPQRPTRPRLPGVPDGSEPNFGLRIPSVYSMPSVPPPSFFASIGPRDPDEAGPVIDELANGIRVAWQRTKVVQNLLITLTPLKVIAPVVVGDQHYDLIYRIIAENMPEPVEGKITLSIRGLENTSDLLNLL